jgi:hypothetical protein
MKQLPPAAPHRASSQVANLCFHGTHDATAASRQKATFTIIAAMKPATVRITMVTNSGVPKKSAATRDITAAGMRARFIADFIKAWSNEQNHR